MNDVEWACVGLLLTKNDWFTSIQLTFFLINITWPIIYNNTCYFILFLMSRIIILHTILKFPYVIRNVWAVIYHTISRPSSLYITSPTLLKSTRWSKRFHLVQCYDSLIFYLSYFHLNSSNRYTHLNIFVH